MISITLVGSPNVGKTSLFNSITGASEHVGNWHGVTVDKKRIECNAYGTRISVCDLPGLYSLTIYSPEEALSRNAVINGESDVFVNVCDSLNLSKSLYLTLQLLECGVNTVVALSMADELQKSGKSIDTAVLQNMLKVPVVLTSCKHKSSVDNLIKTAIGCKNSSGYTLNYLNNIPIDRVKRLLNCTYFQAIKVLEQDEFIVELLRLTDKQKRQIAEMGDYRERIAIARHGYIEQLLRAAEKTINPAKTQKIQRTLDRIFLNKYLALPIFFLVMAAIFFVTFSLVGQPLSGLIDTLFKTYIYNSLSGLITLTWLKSLILDGILGGICAVLVFLPQITILSVLLSIMEESGYISRVAFITDGLFGRFGLNGRAAFTMIMGFGCSASAILTARTIEDNAMRKKTVILTPFFSCSAKLPIYTTLASLFFGSNPLIIFLLYVLGVLFALLLARILEKTRLISKKPSFIMELPKYRVVGIKRILTLTHKSIRQFIVRVATVILLLNVVMWVLTSIGTGGYTSDGNGSLMHIIAGFIAPVLRPIGLGDWRIATALLSGLAAKELAISTIMSLGGVGIIPNGLVALSFMMFVLFYSPCIATLAVIKKEAGVRWLCVSLAVQTVTAYLASFFTYTLGLLYIKHISIFITVICVLAIFVCLLVLRRVCHKQADNKHNHNLIQEK